MLVNRKFGESVACEDLGPVVFRSSRARRALLFLSLVLFLSWLWLYRNDIDSSQLLRRIRFNFQLLSYLTACSQERQ